MAGKSSVRSICCTVTNDLVFDQRMSRICTSLAKAGYAVTLVGRERKGSEPLREKPFRQVRLRCFWEKGKLFYLEYNLRLFFYLLRNRYDILCAIDLDTILPNYAVARLRSQPWVYDAHEYFTEMEEVVARPMIHRVWKAVERWTVPNARYAYTVSNGYAQLFEEQYGTRFDIVRNATVLQELPDRAPEGPYILYQGAVNVGRGLEALVRAMPNIDCPLYICGKGDIYDDLQALCRELGVTDKVTFWGYVEPEALRAYTLNATIGITLFAGGGRSNQHSLANRFFDYMHAGVPQLAMRYPEYTRFNQEFEVARLVDDLTPEAITEAILELLNDPEYYERLRQQSLAARERYNWQEEEKTLLSVYARIP